MNDVGGMNKRKIVFLLLVLHQRELTCNGQAICCDILLFLQDIFQKGQYFFYLWQFFFVSLFASKEHTSSILKYLSLSK